MNQVLCMYTSSSECTIYLDTTRRCFSLFYLLWNKYVYNIHYTCHADIHHVCVQQKTCLRARVRKREARARMRARWEAGTPSATCIQRSGMHWFNTRVNQEKERRRWLIKLHGGGGSPPTRRSAVEVNETTVKVRATVRFPLNLRPTYSMKPP